MPYICNMLFTIYSFMRLSWKDKLEGWTNTVVFVIIKKEYTMEVIGNYEE